MKTAQPGVTIPAIEAGDERLGGLRVHVARPPSPTTIGVLVYPTIFGLNAAMRGFARDIASAGMGAVVWDPYNGEDPTDEVPEMLGRSKRCEDRAVVADLRTIVDYMHEELGWTSTGGLGWCFGGRLGLVHAGEDDRVRAMCSYNPTIWPDEHPEPAEGRPAFARSDFGGQTLDEFACAAKIRGPVQVCRPEHDLTRSPEYDRLLETLRSRPDPTSYEYYPDSEHGFSYSPGAANARAHRFAWAASMALLSTALKIEVER